LGRAEPLPFRRPFEANAEVGMMLILTQAKAAAPALKGMAQVQQSRRA